MEAGMHSMRKMINIKEKEAVLLEYATNAFNTINSLVVLQNIKHICPLLATTQKANAIVHGWSYVLVQGRHNPRRPPCIANVSPGHSPADEDTQLKKCL